MATIEVSLTEDEIRQACEYWATARVLNEGRALSSELVVTVCHGKPTGTINGCRVWVETDRMKRAPTTDEATPTNHTGGHDG